MMGNFLQFLTPYIQTYVVSIHCIVYNFQGKETGINGGSKMAPEVMEVEVRVDPMLYFCDLDEANDIGPSNEVLNSTSDDHLPYHNELSK